jgi:predicted membrane protein
MEIIDPNQKREFEERQYQHSRHGGHETRGRILAGLVIILIGSLILAQKLGSWFPDWLFSWQMLLIGIGIFVGAKQSFRPGGWIIPIVIGILFLYDRFLPEINLRPYFIPIILIAIGAVMILSPGRRYGAGRWRRRYEETQPVTEPGDEVMNTVSIFGGVKKNVISKNFKGGECVTVFGGSEINLMQSDIQGPVKLELVQIFGGTKLIIPANWQIQADLVSILGDVQDSRLTSKDSIDSGKILIIEGVSIFGGISVKSY